jgi:membrane-bound ClpP family serine protease
MTFVALYFISGLVAYIWLYIRAKKGVAPACSLFMWDDIGLVMNALLWPIMIPFSLIDNTIQEKALKEQENRKEPHKIDLSLEVGKLGEALTPQSPTGRALVDGREYEARSMLAFIPKGTKIRVVGHSMHHLQIEPADPDGIVNADKPRD